MATLDSNTFALKYDYFNPHTETYDEVVGLFLTDHDNVTDAAKAFENIFVNDGEKKKVIVKEIKHLK